MGTTYWASTSDPAAVPLATTVAPAARARAVASTTASSVSSSLAIDQTGKERVECRDGTVCEIGCSQGLGCDLTGLQQLQSDLTGGREFGAAADHEHPGDGRERNRDGRRQPLEFGQVLLQLARDVVEQSGELVAAAGKTAGEQRERGDLVRVGLRRRDCELRTGGKRKHRLCGLREVGVGLVRDCDRECPAVASPVDVLEHVRRSPRLREPDDHRAAQVEVCSVVDEQADRVAHRRSGREAGRRRRRRTRRRCRTIRGRPSGSRRRRAGLQLRRRR